MSDEEWTVQTTAGRGRVLFAGSEEDARQHVRDNFPRLHAEPGASYGEDGPGPDVVLVSPGGKRDDGAHWDGRRWSDDQQPGQQRLEPEQQATEQQTTETGEFQ